MSHVCIDVMQNPSPEKRFNFWVMKVRIRLRSAIELLSQPHAALLPFLKQFQSLASHVLPPPLRHDGPLGVFEGAPLELARSPTALFQKALLSIVLQGPLYT